MTWILSLIKSFWKPIAGILAGLVVMIQRWRITRKQRQIEKIKAENRGLEAQVNVLRQDRAIDDEADNKIEDIRGRVQQAETPEKAAQEVSDGLNEFFSNKSRKMDSGRDR